MAVVCLAGCDKDPAGHARRSIDPVRGTWGLVGRSVISCPAGDCIILHFPPSETLVHRDEGTPDSPIHLDNVLKIVLASDDDDASNDGTVVAVPDRWGGDDADPVTLATFNCASYAVGAILDLHEGDWIDTKIRVETGNTAPFDVVLDSYFEETMRFRADEIDWDAITSSTEILPDDLFCLMRQHDDHVECRHVGRIRRHRDENWLESKLGRGPIVLATLESTAAGYADTFDFAAVFREK